MPSRLLVLATVLCLSSALFAQSDAPRRFQLYGGYSFLSNSLNGVTTRDSADSMPPWPSPPGAACASKST